MKCDDLISVSLQDANTIYNSESFNGQRWKRVYQKQAVDEAIVELKEKQRWRKFPEEKPKWGEEVIVVDDESKYYIVRFSHDLKWISWGKMNTCESNCVKYWMPMPLAPKEVNE